jgi:hypothetical protein
MDLVSCGLGGSQEAGTEHDTLRTQRERRSDTPTVRYAPCCNHGCRRYCVDYRRYEGHGRRATTNMTSSFPAVRY